MGNSSGTGGADLKLDDARAGGEDDARAGGEDDARTAGQSGGTGAAPEVTRAGGEDDARGAGGAGGASSEEGDDIPRGAPEDSRSAER